MHLRINHVILLQIKTEAFLEDLNSILNSGDVPNIYQQEELDKIYQTMKGIVQELGLTATKSNLFSVFQKQVRSNLHTVVSMRYAIFCANRIYLMITILRKNFFQTLRI